MKKVFVRSFVIWLGLTVSGTAYSAENKVDGYFKERVDIYKSMCRQLSVTSPSNWFNVITDHRNQLEENLIDMGDEIKEKDKSGEDDKAFVELTERRDELEESYYKKWEESGDATFYDVLGKYKLLEFGGIAQAQYYHLFCSTIQALDDLEKISIRDEARVMQVFDIYRSLASEIEDIKQRQIFVRFISEVRCIWKQVGLIKLKMIRLASKYTSPKTNDD